MQCREIQHVTLFQEEVELTSIDGKFASQVEQVPKPRLYLRDRGSNHGLSAVPCFEKLHPAQVVCMRVGIEHEENRKLVCIDIARHCFTGGMPRPTALGVEVQD